MVTVVMMHVTMVMMHVTMVIMHVQGDNISSSSFQKGQRLILN